MRFKINSILKGPELNVFRTLWTTYTEAENRYLSQDGEGHGVSTAQQFVIDLFTGHDELYNEDDAAYKIRELEAILPAQMELEAVFRGRSRALAEMLGQVRR